MIIKLKSGYSYVFDKFRNLNYNIVNNTITLEKQSEKYKTYYKLDLYLNSIEYTNILEINDLLDTLKIANKF